MLLKLAALAAASAMLVHATALAIPAFNELLYSATYPWWRHVVFVGINGTLAWLLPRPPAWLVWPFSLLTVQVLYSHGLGGWRHWTQTGQINWLDPLAVIGVPLVLVLLIAGDPKRVALRTKHTEHTERT